MRYLLLATLSSALFFAAYWLLMRKEKRHTMVRFYMVGTLVLALLLPTVHLQIAVPHQYVMNEGATGIFPTLKHQTAQTSPTGQTSPTQQTDINWLQWLWLAGVAISAVLLAVRLLALRRRMRRLPFAERDGVLVALLDDDTPAFSFGRHIVVGTQGFSEAEVQQLVGHERVHVQQGHTADILLCEVAKCVLWFNPFIYLYARELKRVHEYIADSEMMSTDYAELFYHQVSGKQYMPLCNTFDYGMVHQRIAMMAGRRTSRGWLKPLVALPLATVVLLAACQPKNSPLVGRWEYVSGTTEHIYHGDSPYPGFTANMGEEHLLDELEFHDDGSATVMAWNSKWDDHKMVYQPHGCEWQIVSDSLLLRNDRGEEAWHILQLDDDTLVFIKSAIFTYHGGDGHMRDTYTYRRKK